MNEITLKYPTQKQRPECWFWAGWEPRRHYRRRGGSVGTFYFGNGKWVDEWEEHLFSDEGIERAADLGASILVTQFYKGMGRQVESLCWPGLKDFVRRCHRHGIKVWGYIQGASLYPEIIRAEQPELDEWSAREFNGAFQYWGNHYYRRRPCLTSPGYRDYFLGIVREGIGEIGLDGLHVDNSYYRHCWCQRCQKKFREYLAARGDLEELTGIPNPAFVDAPPLPEKANPIPDPLQILFMQFGVEVRQEFFRLVKEAVQQENPEATLSGNPAFPRADLSSKRTLALDPSRESENFDFVCAENGNQTRYEGGVFVGQSEAFLFAEAGGYRTWSTTWRNGAFGNSPPPDPGALWAVMAEEFSYAAGIQGNNWAFRPSGEGAGFLCDKLDAQTRVFCEASAFFSELSHGVLSGDRRSHTDVGLLVDPHSLSIAGSSEMSALREVMQYLQSVKIPMQVIFSTNEIPSSITTLVVWGMPCLSRTVMSQITEFGERPGCRVVLSSTAARFDEWHVAYDFGWRRQWQSPPAFYLVEATAAKRIESNGKAHFHDGAIHLSGTLRERLDPFFQTSEFPRRMRFDLPESVLVHTEEGADGQLLVHLREQSGSGKPICGAKVCIAEGPGLADKASFYSPQQPKYLLSQVDEEYALPDFMYYGLLVLPKKRG